MEFSLKQFLIKEKDIIDDGLNKYLPKESEKPEILHKAMRYSVLSNGKRIRPILLKTTYEALGGTSNIIPAAASLELIHCFSLIHDDLPILDNDDYRRGILTCHKKFDEPIALLAGDALLAHSFYLLSNEQVKHSTPNLVVKAIKELSEASSDYGITGGQVFDIMAEKGQIDHNEENLKYIHNKKTGSLIRASVRMGAILADASDEHLNILTRAAENIGLAFQIKDDVLDEIGDENQVGKTLGRDKELGKLTYVSIYGLQEAINKYEELLNESLSLLDFLGNKGNRLKEIFNFIVNRKY